LQQGGNLIPQTTGLYGTSMLSQPTGFGQSFQQLPHQQTGIQSPQVFVNGQTAGPLFGTLNSQQQTSGFQSVSPQPPGPQPPFPSIPQQQQTRSFLPPTLQPQQTGQANNFGPHSGQGPQPAPSIPKQSAPAPLQAQKTGPPPPVRFGVTGDMKRLTPQPTGRRANLSQATPQNPFGF